MLSDYSIEYINGSLVITPAQLVITANAQSREYSGETHEFGNSDFTVQGLKLADLISSVTLVSGGIHVSESPSQIIPSNAQPGTNTILSDYLNEI